MTPEQRDQLSASIVRLIVEDYRDDFEYVYERAVQFFGTHPFQPNNDIRNVMNHLGRVCAMITADGDFEEADAHIERARRHVFFAKHDCLTILLLERLKALRAFLIGAETRYEQLFPDFHVRLAEISARKRNIPAAPLDNRAPKAQILNDIVTLKQGCDRLEQLATECMVLEEEMRDFVGLQDASQAKQVSLGTLMQGQQDFAKAIARIDTNLARLVAPPALDQFKGVVSVRFRTADGSDLTPALHRVASENRRDSALINAIAVKPNQPIQAIIKFDPASDENPDGTFSDIDIAEGNKVENVRFEVELESRTISFPDARQSTLFAVKQGSQPMVFDFNAPEQYGKHELFVQVWQKNRLVEVLPTTMAVVKV